MTGYGKSVLWIFCLVVLAGLVIGIRSYYDKHHVTYLGIFQLPQGEVLSCLSYEQTNCGILLKGCGFDQKETFDCMQGVTYIGPLEKPVPVSLGHTESK